MKGPFERLKYDLRRVWECPECHHKERVDGTVTTVLCRCQAKKDFPDQVVMTLVEDRIQRRFPIFVPPTGPIELSTATEVEAMEEPATSSETFAGESSTDSSSSANDDAGPNASESVPE